MIGGMKTTAYLLGIVAVIALLALNLTESIRIRKALCGEYVVHSEKVDTGDADAIIRENTLRWAGYRDVGSREQWGRTQLLYERIGRSSDLQPLPKQ